MSQNVFEEFLDIADPVRHTRDIGVNAYRHHTRGSCAVLIEPVEVPDSTREPLFRGVLSDRHHADIVYLECVRHGDDRAGSGGDFTRLVIEYAVRDILDPFFGKYVDGVEGLRQPRTLPAARRFSGNGSNGFDGSPYSLALILDIVHRALNVSVSQKFP